MSKINEILTVTQNMSVVRRAIQRAGKTFQSLVENGDSFEIKETVQRTILSTTLPTTVKVSLASAGRGDGVRITFVAKNMGIGPLQSKACKSRLGAVKNTILDEIDQIEREDEMDQNSGFDALMKLKQLLDSGVINEEEFAAKKKQILNM